MPRLTTLGALAVVDERGPVTGSAGRGRNLALLAVLARAPAGGVSRDKLAALLWPESDQERARHSLDQAAYTIRRALGSEVFAAGATTLGLNPEVLSTDVSEFTSALERGDVDAAADLYAGPFLDGFHLADAVELAHWVDAERAELASAFARALERSAERAREAGDLDRVVRDRRRAAALEPLGARATLALMRALEDAGDRTGALNAARVHAALVRGALDAPPDPSVVAYEQELRRRPPVGAGARPSRPASTRPDRPASAVGVAAPPLPPTRRPRRRNAVVAGVGVAVLVTGFAAFTASRTGPGPSPAEGRLPRVAVVPFENETGVAELAAAGTMAADWITEGLVRTGLVRVVEGAPASDATVAGRLYLERDTVWLHARVISSDGVVLVALERVATDPANPSQALEPLRQRVLGALGALYDPRLGAWAESARRPPSYPAYLEYVAGLEAIAMPRDVPRAIAHFRAASADPGFALPSLWMAWAATLGGDFALADSVVSALDPRSDDLSPMEAAWWQRISASVRGDNESSYRAAERMVALAPRSGWVLALANAALDTNRPAVAVAVLEQAGMGSLGAEAGYGWFLLTTAHHLLGAYGRELEASLAGIDAVGESWGYLGPAIPALAALGKIEALERRLDGLTLAQPLEGGAPAGVVALTTAILELRAHGHVEAADALVAGRLDGDPAAELGVRGSGDPPGVPHLSGPALEARLDLLYELDRLDELERLLDLPAMTASEALSRHAIRALVAARRGGDVEPATVTAELQAMEEPYSFGAAAYWAARVEAVAGDPSRAIGLLKRAFDRGQGAPTWYGIHLSRDFAALRDEPLFQELIRPRPGLPPLSGR